MDVPAIINAIPEEKKELEALMEALHTKWLGLQELRLPGMVISQQNLELLGKISPDLANEIIRISDAITDLLAQIAIKRAKIVDEALLVYLRALGSPKISSSEFQSMFWPDAGDDETPELLMRDATSFLRQLTT